jgi:hypothetical protein
VAAGQRVEVEALFEEQRPEKDLRTVGRWRFALEREGDRPTVHLERTREDVARCRILGHWWLHLGIVGRPVGNRVHLELTGQEVACLIGEGPRLVRPVEVELECIDALQAKLRRVD